MFGYKFDDLLHSFVVREIAKKEGYFYISSTSF